MHVATRQWMAQDLLVSRVWQCRRQRANKARGVVPPPILAPAGGAVQLPPAAPPPPASALQMGVVPVTVQQPTYSVNPPRDAAPPTSVDIEAMAGLWNHAPQETSSVPITSAASPPPSTLPSWIQISAIADSADEQPQRSVTTPSSPAGAEAPSQAASVRLSRPKTLLVSGPIAADELRAVVPDNVPASVTFPSAVLGITAHFQSYAVRYGHGFRGAFFYTIIVACFTVIFEMAHLVSLILELDASVSAAAFRKGLTGFAPAVVPLELLWFGVTFLHVLQYDMDVIGGYSWGTPPDYHETNPHICMEWAISLGCVVGIIITLPAMHVATQKWMAQDILASRVWQWRRQRANKAVPPLVIAPAGAFQLQLAAPPPPASDLPMGPVPVTVQQPTHSVSPSRDAAPPTSIDIEAMASLSDTAPQETSSVPITSAAPPPSTPLS
ncbi:hypothetical protein FRC04_001476 [Tulasnella sp. 424]|nr:hypothetical protein FRC04_001476 [Tulasnella sp. 424]KAG8974534.1 hypothetical protein FRC05_007166 [Tulasnella sp. 425]